MSAIAIQPQTESFTIEIPKIDLKRFKGLVKAMGWTFRKTEPKVLGDLTDEECWEHLCKTQPEGLVMASEEEEATFEKWLAEQ